METLFGIRCNDFVMLAADMTNNFNIMQLKNDDVKIYPLSTQLMMAVVGEDANQFAEYIAKNVQLYKMRNGYNLNPKAASHFIRQNLAEYLRSQSPYMVNLLLGGFDEEKGGQLFFMDYLASYQEMPFCTHGYGGMMSTSILDRNCTPDMTVERAYEVMQMCVREVQKRLIINMPNFHVKVVDKDGVRDLPDITVKQLSLKS